MKKLTVTILSVIVVAALFLVSACGTAPSPSESQAQTSASPPAVESQASQSESQVQTKVYKIALSNSFAGNDWRQEMEKCAQYVAQTDVYKDQVSLSIVDCDNTPEAQAASIDDLILQNYDAILVIASSPTGLNAALQRAVDKGIVVVVFNQMVTLDTVYKLNSDYGAASAAEAKYLAEAIGGKGNVVVDRGLPGAEASDVMYQAIVEVFNQYPDITIVSEFDGQYAEGPTLAGMNAAIAACPEIDAVCTQGYTAPVVKALQDAGRPLVPIGGWAYNSSTLSLAQNNCDGFLILGSPTMSASAMKMALDILNGSQEYKQGEVVDYAVAYYAMKPETENVGVPMTQIELGVNAFPDLPSGFYMPVILTDIGIDSIPNDVLISK